MNSLYSVAIFVAILIVGLLFSRQHSNISGFQDIYAPVRKMKEGFQDIPVIGRIEVDEQSGPAKAALDDPRKPYHLLSGVLQDAPRDTIGCLRAGCCNETDFEARTNLTGNYLQRTNNYKRSYPDNCTGPLHEFTMAFYKTTPLK